jgi:hypothetical protein
MTAESIDMGMSGGDSVVQVAEGYSRESCSSTGSTNLGQWHLCRYSSQLNLHSISGMQVTLLLAQNFSIMCSFPPFCFLSQILSPILVVLEDALSTAFLIACHDFDYQFWLQIW